MESAAKPNPPLPQPGQLPPLLPSPHAARDLRVDMRLDLAAGTRINQQHGIEFTSARPHESPGFLPTDAPPLTRFSGTSLTYQPAQAFDITLGGRVQQSVHSSGIIPSETFSHSVTLGSTPHPDTRVELRLRDEMRVHQIGPASETQALGLNLSQRLPGTPLRLSLNPEFGTTETTSPLAIDSADTTRLSGNLAWEIAPAATWSLGSQVESTQSSTLATERQRLSSGVQFRPNSDFGLSVATEYGETRRDQPGIDPSLAGDPERDLRLRLSPSLSISDDITARMDIDFGLRDSPASTDWGQGGGGISLSIGGRF